MAKSNKKRPVQHTPSTSGPGSGSERSAARQEAAAVALKMKKKQQARRAMIQGGIGVAVVFAVIVVTIVVLLNRGGDADPSAADGPEQATADGSFVVGNPDADLTVTIVEDFQCPACKQFESIVGDQLDEYAAGDEVRLEYRSIAFLDNASSTDYSSRALNASACMMDEGTETWLAWHGLMFDGQPAEGGAGLTDAELAAIAGEAGADEAEKFTCIEANTYGDWVKATTEKVMDEDFTGTPSVYVNGEKIEAQDLVVTVEAALAP